jgi:hypothetical protein
MLAIAMLIATCQSTINEIPGARPLRTVLPMPYGNPAQVFRAAAIR